MSKKIVQLNEEVIKEQIKELVRSSVEQTLNELLEAEAEKLTRAARYERSEARWSTAAATMIATSPLPLVTSRSCLPPERRFHSKVKLVAKMLKAIHAQEDKKAAR